MNVLPISRATTAIRRLVIAPSGPWLARLTTSGTVDVFSVCADPLAADALAFQVPPDVKVRDVAIDTMYNRIIALCEDGVIRFVSIDGVGPSGIALQAGLRKVSPLAMALSSNGERLAAVGEDGHVYSWKLANTTGVISDEAVFLASRRPASLLASNADGSVIAASGPESPVTVHFVQSARTESVPPHPSYIYRLMFVSSGTALLVASFGAISLTPLHQDALGHTSWLNIDSGLMLDCDASRNGRLAAGVADDGNMHLWRLYDGLPEDEKAIGRFPYESRLVRVAFSPDSRWLAAGAEDGAVLLWDLQRHSSLENPYVIKVHASRVHRLHFLKTCLITASGYWDDSAEDSVVHLWHLGEPHPASYSTALHAHQADVSAVGVATGQNFFATGDAKGGTVLWVPT